MRVWLTLLLLCFFTLPAYAVGLRDSAIISDSTIKLGDLFYDLPRGEDRVLGSAPRPGQEMTLNARTLMKIAIAMDLPWRPNSAAEHIVLKREATIIDYDQIKETIHTALYDEGVLGQFEISVPREYQQIILPADQPAKMSVTSVNVDRRANTFNITIAAPSADNPIHHMRIRGRMDSVVEVPVLKDNLQHGRVIRTQDIEMIRVKDQGLSQKTVLDVNSLIGMTARRVIVAGRPLQTSDLVAPEIISRGELVTMFLTYGGMRLTTQVKALESGSMGDVIRVVNTESNESLQAIVKGTRSVEVIEN